jgi:hypothetical protein
LSKGKGKVTLKVHDAIRSLPETVELSPEKPYRFALSGFSETGPLSRGSLPDGRSSKS